MGGAIVLFVLCIMALIRLSNSGSGSSTKTTYTPPAKPNTPPYTPPKPEDDEMAKARSRFKAIEENRKKHSQRTTLVKRVLKRPLDWFVVARAQDQISEAEKLIAQELNKYKVDWYREVAFEGLRFEYGYARYDFLILTPKGIHLIEYDGRSSHCTKEQKERDAIKDKFCSNNGIPLTRYNRQHYYHLEREIALLLMDYGIKKK